MELRPAVNERGPVSNKNQKSCFKSDRHKEGPDSGPRLKTLDLTGNRLDMRPSSSAKSTKDAGANNMFMKSLDQLI